MYFALLEIDDEIICEIELTPEEGEPGTFTGRTWVNHKGGNEFIIMIGEPELLHFEYSLNQDVTDSGKTIWKQSDSDGEKFTWSNLIQGKGSTLGLTVGLKIPVEIEKPSIPEAWNRDRIPAKVEKVKNYMGRRELKKLNDRIERDLS